MTIFPELHKQLVCWLDFGAGLKLITHCYILFVWVVHAKDVLCMSLSLDFTPEAVFVIHYSFDRDGSVHGSLNPEYPMLGQHPDML